MQDRYLPPVAFIDIATEISGWPLPAKIAEIISEIIAAAIGPVDFGDQPVEMKRAACLVTAANAVTAHRSQVCRIQPDMFAHAPTSVTETIPFVWVHLVPFAFNLDPARNGPCLMKTDNIRCGAAIVDNHIAVFKKSGHIGVKGEFETQRHCAVFGQCQADGLQRLDHCIAQWPHTHLIGRG